MPHRPHPAHVRLRAVWRRILRLVGGPFSLALVPFLTLGAFYLHSEAAMIAAAVVFPTLIAAAQTLVRREPRSVIPTDSYTGLPVKEALVPWADGAQSVDAAVLTISIDGIDRVEQRFGREMRRAVMKEAATRLAREVRDDDILVRLGASGFAVGLSEVAAPVTETLLTQARRLQKLFDEPFADRVQRVYCSASVGITPVSLIADMTPERLLDAAEETSDIALASGPGAVWLYRAERVTHGARNADRTEELIAALETGQIVPHFQPQVTTKAGHVLGFEALARWDHPEHGLIAPAEFLPEIERAGLNQRLTEVILKRSLTALRNWETAGFPIRSVSVNFNGDELRNPRLADYIGWELEQSELAPERLVVEVLESVISERREDSISRTLTTLAQMGCHVDLDDFGTGYTSIINIRRFSVSRIKLDRCLVAGVDRDAEQSRMVQALLSMSEALEIEALAEGVETPAERIELARLGCRQIQGFVVARPMAFEATIPWLRQRRVIGPDELPPISANPATTRDGETARSA